MLTFTKEQIGFIEKAHKQVQDLETEQEIIYAKLLTSLNLEKGSFTEDCLFDYVYNNYGTLKQKDDNDKLL